MQTKKLVFNSDDFGMSTAFNAGVLNGFLKGLITSTCICANGEAFEQAIFEVLPRISDIGLGVHLNIIEGKSLEVLEGKPKRNSALYDSTGRFKNGYDSLILKSFDENFIKEVEAEFRLQIEKVMEFVSPDHLNSHVHTHAIPAIFELTCKLAAEYGIKFVRTQFEQPYIVPDFKKHLTVKYPVNLIKVALLNGFTIKNRETAKKYGILTNDYLVGVGYTGFMDVNTISYGLKALENKDGLCEILIHPCFAKQLDVKYKTNYEEYKSAISPELKKTIKTQNRQLVSYREIIEK